MTNNIKIIKTGNTTTGLGSLDYVAFDWRSFDAMQTYSNTIKLSSPTSIKLSRNNTTSFSIKIGS